MIGLRSHDFSGGTAVKNLPAIAGETRDVGLIPQLGRLPRVGNGNPLQYSCLQNPMDREAWWATVHGVARSQTWRRPGSGRCGQGITDFWEEKGTMNYLIKEASFGMMHLRAHPQLQSRKEISEEKKDPQLSPSLTEVLWLNTLTWDPEAWAQIWAPSLTSCVTLGKGHRFSLGSAPTKWAGWESSQKDWNM